MIVAPYIAGRGPDQLAANKLHASHYVGRLADRSYETLQRDPTARLQSADLVSPQELKKFSRIEVYLSDAVAGDTPRLPGRWPVPWDNPIGAPVA